MEEQQDAHVKAYYANIKYLLEKAGIDHICCGFGSPVASKILKKQAD